MKQAGMDQISLRLDRNRGYGIVIGHGITPCFGEWVKKVGGVGESGAGEKVGIVTHPRVMRLHGSEVIGSLKKAGFSPVLFFLPEGEQNKTLRAIDSLYDRLIKRRFERSSFLIAMGGGVIGDITGFAAATFLRGIRYIQYPTTVVAQVDAAIGGKTGVDHPKGKNLIGAFHQPLGVFIDSSVLRTLPKREFVAGLAEVVKYGVILDPKLFEFMEKNAKKILSGDEAAVLNCIKRSVADKAAVVEADEQESGLRKILNYGHTLGHAIETLTGYRQYKHGEAVSIGMMMAAQIANAVGIAKVDIVKRQQGLLQALGLPIRCPKLDPSAIINVMGLDKKVARGNIHFVLPERIGVVRVMGVQNRLLQGWVENFCSN